MLYEHQQTGADWLAERLKALLGDVPGLGKTRTLIEGMARAAVGRPLIVCPAIVRSHWAREVCALGWHPIVDAPIIKSYDEIVRGGERLMAELTLRERVDALVLDEFHYCKHMDAKRSLLLLGKNGYARRIPRVYAASGTPMPKHPGELWTVLVSLFPEVMLEYGIKTALDWEAMFCITRPRFLRGRWVEKVVGMRNMDLLREILERVMLRRTLESVGLDVPPLDWQMLPVDSDAVGSALRFESEYADELAPLIERLHRGEPLDEILESIPHIARLRRRIGELKVSPVVELLRAQLADSEEKIVIFAHHRTVLAALRESLESFGVVYVDGDTSKVGRDLAIDSFQSSSRVRVFIGQNLACQTGITLTAAHRVVLVEPDWTAVVNAQLGHRVARIGQQSSHCIVQMVALAGTLDEAIVRQHHRETRQAAELFREEVA